MPYGLRSGVTPLHVEIGLHYHCRTVQHERIDVPIVRAYAENLVEAGLLRRAEPEDQMGDGFAKTDGLAVWVSAICQTPFPVQRWVMPRLPDAALTAPASASERDEAPV